MVRTRHYCPVIAQGRAWLIMIGDVFPHMPPPVFLIMAHVLSTGASEQFWQKTYADDQTQGGV
jgi:hypothetical protein